VCNSALDPANAQGWQNQPLAYTSFQGGVGMLIGLATKADPTQDLPNYLAVTKLSSPAHEGDRCSEANTAVAGPDGDKKVLTKHYQ
jgi:hypothetical protein